MRGLASEWECVLVALVEMCLSPHHSYPGRGALVGTGASFMHVVSGTSVPIQPWQIRELVPATQPEQGWSPELGHGPRQGWGVSEKVPG